MERDPTKLHGAGGTGDNSVSKSVNNALEAKGKQNSLDLLTEFDDTQRNKFQPIINLDGTTDYKNQRP